MQNGPNLQDGNDLISDITEAMPSRLKGIETHIYS